MAALPKARERRPGRVGKPAGRRDKLCEARALLPLEQANNEGLLRSGRTIRCSVTACTLFRGRK